MILGISYFGRLPERAENGNFYRRQIAEKLRLDVNKEMKTPVMFMMFIKNPIEFFENLNHYFR